MDHMLGKGWRDLFDIIITQARKPSFYHQPASRFVCLFVCLLLLSLFLRAQERPATLILTVISGFRITRACHVYREIKHRVYGKRLTSG